MTPPCMVWPLPESSPNGAVELGPEPMFPCGMPSQHFSGHVRILHQKSPEKSVQEMRKSIKIICEYGSSKAQRHYWFEGIHQIKK